MFPSFPRSSFNSEFHHRMTDHNHHHHPNNRVDAAASLLKSCTSLPTLKQIHAHLLRRHLHANASLGSILASLYAALASPAHSLGLLSSTIRRPSLPLFNSAIRALSKSSDRSSAPDAFLLYSRMTREGLAPDNFTYPFLLNCCAAASGVLQGMEVHSRAVRGGFLGFVQVGNALVDMYGKCGDLGSARRMFEEMPVRDVVGYNALLGAHARGGEDMLSARRVFEEMPQRNVISWNAMVVGYANARDLESAREVFDAMPARNLVSWNTMILGYAKNGEVKAARKLFDEMPERNLVSWAALISRYAQNGQAHEALELFREMDGAGIIPDAATMIGVISASAQLGESKLANWVEAYVIRNGIERNDRILTGLVDMHAKCGNVEQACCLFEEIPSKSTFSYTALINGLASHGHGNKALEFFSRMEKHGIEPDGVTYIGVLNACSHTGLVSEGLGFWNRMVNYHRIEPGSDHYACVIDMLGRAGKLKEAHDLVRSMPAGPHAGALGALLSACRNYGEVENAENTAEELFELEPENTGNYMLLWSIYASREQWQKAESIRERMKEKGTRKLPGYSWM